MSRFISSLFRFCISSSLLAFGLCTEPASAQMVSHSTSVTLVAVLPESVSMVASPALAEDSVSSTQETVPITVTTSWVANAQRDSISVYMDYTTSIPADAEWRKQKPSDQRLFAQRLSVENRNASRSDEVHVPSKAMLGFRSANEGFLKLRVQVL